MFETLAKRVRPNDFQALTGKTFEVGGLPPWVCEDALAEFLGPSVKIVEIVNTIKTRWGERERRSYFLKTSPDIIWSKKQGTDLLAKCKVAEKLSFELMANYIPRSLTFDTNASIVYVIQPENAGKDDEFMDTKRDCVSHNSNRQYS